MKRSKKGFTIVELVIVIAVIAILAAVLIPTFSNLIERANISADSQAARQMNVALASAQATDGKPADVGEAIDRLTENGFSDSFDTYTSGCVLMWDREQNLVFLFDREEGKVLYPEHYAGESADQFYLSTVKGCFAGGAGTEEDPHLIATAAQFESLRVAVAEGKSEYYRLTRNLNLGESWMPIGLAAYDGNNGSVQYYADGTTFFSGVFDGNGKSLTLQSPAGNIEDYALFGAVGGTEEMPAVVKNLDMVMNVTKDSAITCGSVATIADGYTKFENITVTGTVTASKQAGGVIGWFAMGTCELKQCVNRANITVTYAGEEAGAFSVIGGICAQASTYCCDEYEEHHVSFVDCRNEGNLSHVRSEGSQAVSIIGHIVGQIADATDYQMEASELSFTNCTHGEAAEIRGWSKAGNTLFEGFDQRTGSFTYEGTPNFNKLLIGGNISKQTTVDGTLYTCSAVTAFPAGDAGNDKITAV